MDGDGAPRRRARCVDRHRRPHARDGRGAGNRSRRPRLVRRHLGHDDGGDDAAVGLSDGASLRTCLGRGGPPRGAGGADVGVRHGLPRRLDGVRARRLRSLPSRPNFRLRLPRPGPGGAQTPRGRWDRAGPYVVGGAVAAAGLYELTPLKSVCLRHCRSPLHFVLGGWRPGWRGAVRMGSEHGAYCVGCCWGLMIVLFALGVMSLFWMALVAAVIFVQKIIPWGERLTTAFAVALVPPGIGVAAAPGSVPALTQPGSNPAMNMKTNTDKMN